MALEPVWIVVVDGGSARFFHRERSGSPLLELEDLPSPAPGHQPPRNRNSLGGGAFAHEQEEQDFLRGVAARIDAFMETKEEGKLAVLAPPRALGVLRDALASHTRKRLVCEIAKDLVHEPVQKLDERLKEHMI